MLFADHLVVLRGGGDLGTGVALRLWRCGFPVVVLDLPHPLAIRRTVAVAEAVTAGTVHVEELVAVRARDADDALEIVMNREEIPVIVDEALSFSPRQVVVDARMLKVNPDTTRADASLVVALGPGYTAGVDCHAVVETARGHHLGRVLWSGAAMANTATPGEVGGKAAERVVRAQEGGHVSWAVAIGDRVEAGQTLGWGASSVIEAPFRGVVRGLISSSACVQVGLKIADIDPRLDTDCSLVSDKALAVGGGVVEAILTWLGRV